MDYKRRGGEETRRRRAKEATQHASRCPGRGERSGKRRGLAATSDPVLSDYPSSVTRHAEHAIALTRPPGRTRLRSLGRSPSCEGDTSVLRSRNRGVGRFRSRHSILAELQHPGGRMCPAARLGSSRILPVAPNVSPSGEGDRPSERRRVRPGGQSRGAASAPSTSTSSAPTSSPFGAGRSSGEGGAAAPASRPAARASSARSSSWSSCARSSSAR